MSGVVSANEVASFAVVIDAAAMLTVPIAPVSKFVPADIAFVNASIASQLALCSEATTGAPLLNVYGMLTVAIMFLLSFCV